MRFTDTEKWSDKWFRALSPNHKLAWNYLCDCCDCIGLIEVDEELAEFQVGEAVDFDSLIESSEGRIERISGGKLWLVKFCEFQYGQLKPGNKPHDSYIRRLQKACLLQRVTEGYAKGSLTLKEKEKETEKEKGGDARGGRFVRPTVAEIHNYCVKRSNTVDAQSLWDFYESKGWMIGKNPMKDWKAAVRTWERRETKSKKPSGGQKYDKESNVKAGAGKGW